MTEKKVGILAGKFKPPHRGHFQAIKDIDKMNDETHVFISPIELDGITGTISEKILLEYFKDQINDDPTIFFHIAKASPVKEALTFISELGDKQNAQNVQVNVYALSDDMARFKTLDNFKGNLKKLNKVSTDRIDGMSSRVLRKALKDNDKETFKTGLPDGVDSEKIWKMLKEEMSGTYSVPADSFNAVNKYDFNVQPSPISTNLGGIPAQWTNSNPISRWDFMTNPIINTVRENQAFVLSFEQFLTEQRINNKK